LTASCRYPKTAGLILFEVDLSFVDESFRLKEPYRTATLEATAATAFQEKTNAPLRPYDNEGRNRFYQDTNSFPLQRDFSQALGELYRNGQLTSEARALLETVMAFDAVRDSIQKDRPEVINSPACDAVIEKKQYYAMKGMKRIVELTPALRQFQDFIELRDEEWERRNQTVVKTS